MRPTTLGMSDEETPAPMPPDVTRDWLLTRFPMNVCLRRGGPHVLLRWSTEDDGSHVLVARSEAGVVHAMGRLLERGEDVRLHDYCKIEVVAPSAAMSLQHAERAFREESEDFWRHAALRLREREDEPLSKSIERCARYEPWEGYSSQPSRAHQGCRHCFHGFVISGPRCLARYAIVRDQWVFDRREMERRRADFRVVANPSKPVGPSLAEPAADGETVHVVAVLHGDHRDGSALRTIDPSEGPPSFPILFAFRRLDELDSSDIMRMAQRGVTERRKANRAEERRRADLIARRQEEDLALLLRTLARIPDVVA